MNMHMRMSMSLWWRALVQAGLFRTESDSLRPETDEGRLQVMLDSVRLLTVRDD